MKIRVKSITYAMKSKDVLQSVGIDATVVKDLRPSGGCIYAVSFPDRYREDVIRLLRDNGVALHAAEKWEDYK